MRVLKFFVLLSLAFVITTSPALAHEFLVKPDKTVVAPGEVFGVTVSSAHVFIVSEELENAANVSLEAVDGLGSHTVALHPDAKHLTYVGRTSFAKQGWGILLGHRLPEVWTHTPGGLKKGTKTDYPGATMSSAYEKFSKTLVLVGKPDAAWKKPVGQRLEIVPLTDPASFRSGQEASFLVLYEGKPLSTEVLASYDGCTKTPNSYAWRTETDDKGVAHVLFSHKGFWLVRVQCKAPGTNGVNEHVMRSVLLFSVK
jgi:uncharacterized GH25 family protein